MWTVYGNEAINQSPAGIFVGFLTGIFGAGYIVVLYLLARKPVRRPKNTPRRGNQRAGAGNAAALCGPSSQGGSMLNTEHARAAGAAATAAFAVLNDACLPAAFASCL